MIAPETTAGSSMACNSTSGVPMCVGADADNSYLGEGGGTRSTR